jgi:hypothetical protein
MKTFLSVITLLLAFSYSTHAQQDTTSNPMKVTAIIIDGDTLPYVALPDVYITGTMDAEAMKRLQEYYRLRFNVIKMYPYAKLAAVKIKEINNQLATLDKKKDKKKFIKEQDEQLKKDFEGTVKNFSQRQGDVLIKLINRETGNTSYELVKELKGSFNAFIWQTAARLFGHNLKDTYDPQGEDKNIEAIVQQIEAGQVN